MTTSVKIILAVVGTAIVGWVLYLVTKPKTDANTGANTGANTDTPPQKAPICFKRKPETEGYFAMRMGDDLKAFQGDARGKGYSDNQIRHVAAFLKGMDAGFNMTNALLYAKEIRDFMAKKPPLTKNADFGLEILNQIFDTGELQCDAPANSGNTFSANNTRLAQFQNAHK